MRTCEFVDGCNNPVFGTDRNTNIGYCKYHQWCRTDNQKKRKRVPGSLAYSTRKPIKKVSDKLSKRQKVYTLKRRIYLLEHPKCMVNVEGCTQEATQVHHAKGRDGALLIEVKYFRAVCSSCHKYVELHPEEAKEKGWSVSRLSQ